MDIVGEQSSVWGLAKHKHSEPEDTWPSSIQIQTHIWAFSLLFCLFRQLSPPLFTSHVFLSPWLHCSSLWLRVSDVSVCGFWMFAPVIPWKVAFISSLFMPLPPSVCLSLHVFFSWQSFRRSGVSFTGNFSTNAVYCVATSTWAVSPLHDILYCQKTICHIIHSVQKMHYDQCYMISVDCV